MYRKRILVLISMLVLLSVVLVACAAPEPEEATEVDTAVGETEVEEEASTEAEPVAEAEEEAEPVAEEEAEPVAEAEEDDAIKIGFLAGVQDPFYFTMERGARQAAADFGAELIVQIPDEWNTTVQTPMLDAMVARGDLDFLFLAPTATEAMIAPLQNAADTGLPIITNDTFIGDGDYENGPVTFPLSYIGSDNVLGGEMACHALAAAIGETGKVYIQNTVPGVSTTDQREEGCKAALEEYPDVELIGVDFNDDDPSKAQAQVEATLQRVPDLAGIFGTNVFSAQGAGTVVANQGLADQVQVVAFDATELAIEQLRSGVVDLVIAQKPADMGYLAVAMGMAHLDGVTSIPKRIPTGYQVITLDNVDDPEIAQYIYTAGGGEAESSAPGTKIAFLAGVQDPFYFTMQRGAEEAMAHLEGAELIVQIPEEWNTTVQTPMLDALVARGDLDFLFLAPTAKEAMIAPLQNAVDAGLPIITNDTFIGDGDYLNGPVTFPLSYIGSDNVLGGEIACHALAAAIGETGKVYIQNTVPGVSTTDQREEGCKAALEDYPDVELVGVDYNDDDPSKAQAQVEATLQRVPDLAGIFGTNVFSAQGAGTVLANQGLGDQVAVVAFDATELAMEQLRSGVVDLVIAQKPADMGYLAVAMGMAHLNGVGSIPLRIPTGYQVITTDNMDDPEVLKFVYTK